MAWDTLGRLWVINQENVRYTLFDTTGRLVTEYPRPITGFTTWRWPGVITRAGHLIELTHVPDDVNFRQALLRIDSELQPGDTIRLPAWDAAVFRLERRGMRVAYRVPHSPALVWVLDPRGYLWYAITERYRIVQVGLGGDTLRVIERAYSPVPVTEAEKDSEVAGLRYFLQQGGIVDRSRIPDVKPPFYSFTVDDHGYLWVPPSRPEGPAGSVYDVFDAEGRYLGQVTTGVRSSPLVVRGASLYALVHDEDDVAYVVRFRIQGR